MSLSIGESVVSARYESEFTLSSDLLQLSQTVQMVCREATNGYVLSGMVLGPLAGIALKCKSLSLFSHFFKDSKIASLAYKPLASSIGLLGEGGIIHFTPVLLQTGSFGPNAWNGSLSSTLTIMACKMTARFGLPPSMVMNHMVQNCAIMGAQEVSGVLGLSERVHGNWMMRFSEAEVSNIQISAGMSIVHGTAHGIRYMEATFQVQTTVRGSFNLFEGIRRFLSPTKQAITDNGMFAAVPEALREEIQAKQARDRAIGFKMTGDGEVPRLSLVEISAAINALDPISDRATLISCKDAAVVGYAQSQSSEWEVMGVYHPVVRLQTAEGVRFAIVTDVTSLEVDSKDLILPTEIVSYPIRLFPKLPGVEIKAAKGNVIFQDHEKTHYWSFEEVSHKFLDPILDHAEILLNQYLSEAQAMARAGSTGEVSKQPIEEALRIFQSLWFLETEVPTTHAISYLNAYIADRYRILRGHAEAIFLRNEILSRELIHTSRRADPMKEFLAAQKAMDRKALSEWLRQGWEEITSSDYADRPDGDTRVYMITSVVVERFHRTTHEPPRPEQFRTVYLRRKLS